MMIQLKHFLDDQKDEIDKLKGFEHQIKSGKIDKA